MRPTRLGLGALGLLALSLAVALSTGNNLLMLLCGALISALALSLAGIRKRRQRLASDSPQWESLRPFGFIVHRLPPTKQKRAALAEVWEERKPVPGVPGEGLVGARWATDADDARLIHWKLTAKTGRPVVAIWEGEQSLPATATPRPPRVSALKAERAPTVQDSPALRRLSWLGTLLVAAGFFLIDDLHPALPAALCAASFLSWALHARGRSLAPPWVWRIVSLAVLLFVSLVDWRINGVAVANAHLLGYLLLYRALQPPSSRELGQFFLILYLCFFLISALTISLWYFAFFLLYLPFACAWLMLAAGARPVSGRDWLSSAGPLLASAAVITAASFLLLPRADSLRRLNPFAHSGIDQLQMAPKAVMGFSEDVSLGFFGELKRSTARVMRVRPLSTASDAPDPLLIRGAAYDSFNGRRWSRDRIDFKFRVDGRVLPAMAGRAWLPGDETLRQFPGAGGQTYDFTIYPMNLAVLFTAGTAVSVAGLGDAAGIDHTDTVTLAAPYSEGASYRLTGRPDPVGYSSAVPSYESLMLPRFLQLPKDLDPRISALAKEAAAGTRDSGRIAARVAGLLRRRCAYSTRWDRGGRALEDFLFRTKRGNCEYFATAVAVLLRLAGVPSRLVTGFRADQWNEFGKFYDVRQGQAHAWVEYYDPTRGWLTLDPTPPSGAFSAGTDAVTRRLESWFDAAQLRWYRSVVGFDQYSRSNALFRLRRLRAPPARQALKAAAMATAIVLIWLTLAAAKRRLRAPKDLFSRAERALSRAGLPRRPHWTPMEYALAVTSNRPELGATLFLARLRYQARFAGRPLSQEQIKAGRLALREMTAQLWRKPLTRSSSAAGG